MRLTFIVTIDPVKDLALLGVLVHSLNLQTRKTFDVVFHNQTLLAEDEIFASARCRPNFKYAFLSIPREQFLGSFPVWDLYAFHAQALQSDLLGDYFMSVHMEEFFDVNYVESATRVLDRNGFDILFGNLSHTSAGVDAVSEITATRTAEEFELHLQRSGLKNAVHRRLHASFGSRRERLKKRLRIGRRDFDLTPNAGGYTRLGAYHEDLYFMRKEFARRYDWFLAGRAMYFEDIHICEQPGVCELSTELAKITAFPVYLNASKLYHLSHGVFYYQLEDPAFTDGLLALPTDDPALCALKKAIATYRSGHFSLREALTYTRQNEERTGTQNLNYRYHLDAIRAAEARMRRPVEKAEDALRALQPSVPTR
jgi:hypothetical protein